MATVRLRIVNGQSLKGDTPFIGNNGNWWIGETDTGVPATQDLSSLNQSVDELEEALSALDGDALKTTPQVLTEEKQEQARENIGAAPSYTYGSADIEAGSESPYKTGTLHFIFEPVE